MKPPRALWAYVPALLLGAMVAGLLVMARIAHDDPGFSVEKDYYDKAVAWDRHRDQLRDNARLGWKLRTETRPASAGNVELRARLVDGSGNAVRSAKLEVEAFHNARAGQVLTARLDESEGWYRTELPMHRAGLWELRFTALRGSHTFTDVVRTELP